MKNNRSALVRFVVCAALVAGIVAWGILSKTVQFNQLAEIKFDPLKLIRLAVLILAVIAVESLLVFILKKIKPKKHRSRSVLSVVCSLLKYVAAIVILCVGLGILGVNVTTIAASVGIIALVIGFSAESLIADIVTGAFIIFENQYNVGDIVEIDGFRGTVTDIGIRTTCITDPVGNIKIVNNSAMKNILNRSDNVSVSISDIGIPYATDLEALEAQIPGLMKNIQSKHPDLMKSAPRYLGVQELGDSAVVLRFAVDVDEENIYTGMRTLNHDLFLGFRKLGIEVPFPQRDVHLDTLEK
ncbi:MAG: mechanosensitive ion channel family protein [Clostridia bacterium]|nr:mechanosensitive ion channel family protein [Clostridia bacterium]